MGAIGPLTLLSLIINHGNPDASSHEVASRVAFKQATVAMLPAIRQVSAITLTLYEPSAGCPVLGFKK